MSIVAISIDKVQSFLYYAIHAHEQEKQTNSGTLRSIMESSKLISERFYEKIESVFANMEKDMLLQCSGVCIFTTSSNLDDINGCLKQLFQYYYTQYHGQLLLKYVCFEQDSDSDADKLNAIKSGKERLKRASCLNNLIKENQEILFQFQPSTAMESIDIKPEDKDAFAQTINELSPPQSEKEEQHFRIAVIKADLDGIGNLFNEIKDYIVYQNVSDILTQHININALREEVKEIKKNAKEFQIYPLYAAGDDILFAVKISQINLAVTLCQHIWNKMNKDLEDFTKPLSMSIGVDFTFNREPIRYYYERVEKQLEHAKAAPMPESAPCMKICINQYVLYQYPDDILREKQIKGSTYPAWIHFLHSVALLKEAITYGYPAHHVLYGLLEKLTDPCLSGNVLKQSNAVLYHLLPRFIEHPNHNLCKSELLLLEILINQISVEETFGNKKIKQLNFDREQCKRLESFVRLLLLFSDSRFELENLERKACIESWAVKRVQSAVFNRPMRYLYEKSLDDSKKDKEKATVLRDLFVKQIKYTVPKSKKRNPTSAMNVSY